MTCRVARSYSHCAQPEPVPCSECGSSYRMDVRVPSAPLEPRLCPVCAQLLSLRTVPSLHAPRVPMKHQQVA
jgi:hypothetical protein